MEIKKGNRFVCVRGTDGFTKGKVYTTNHLGNHIINEAGSYSPIAHQNYEEYFIPYSKLDRVYTKYTEKLEKLFDDYEGNKSSIIRGDVMFFDNVMRGETGWFVSTSGNVEWYYKNEDYTYLSEQAFIEFMGLAESVEQTSPQPHYDNSNGSLFSLAEQLQLNHWEFDILKRLVRCRKKGQFKEDLQKIKDTCDIYLQEYK